MTRLVQARLPQWLSSSVLALALVVGPSKSSAQARTLTACTPDVMTACAELRLASVAGGLFQLGLRTIGAAADPLLPIAVYNLVFFTGAGAASTAVTSSVRPVSVGGATVSDATAWELFDTGDALFLSALSNRGVGGCAAGADADGFGQAVTTCGAGQFATFTFAPTSVFDVSRFIILDMEAVALTSPAVGASCGAGVGDCVITADTTTTPEPHTVALLAAGLLAIGAGARTQSRARVG